MTFAQAEGVEKLPYDLSPKEISLELRGHVWFLVYKLLEKHKINSTMGGRPFLSSNFSPFLQNFFCFHLKRPIDEYSSDFDYWEKELKSIFFNNDYIVFYGALQFFCKKLHKFDSRFCHRVSICLQNHRAGYRLYNNQILIPAASDVEAHTITNAIDSLKSTRTSGAVTHIDSAIDSYNNGDNAGSVREAIHAVESVVRQISPGSKSLKSGLNTLKRAGQIHPALEEAFIKLYAYASDEQGIRHALLERNEAEVCQEEALFMIGACAAFVTYLVSKGRRESLADSS